jgi:hypothetical protein
LTGNGTGTRVVVWVSDDGGGENGGRERDGKRQRGGIRPQPLHGTFDPSPSSQQSIGSRVLSISSQPTPRRPPAPGTAVINPDRSSLNSRIREDRGAQRERAGRPQDRCTTCGNTATPAPFPDPDSLSNHAPARSFHDFCPQIPPTSPLKRNSAQARTPTP